jgi:L-alanine-DL-glutamate epimerase-like enolase superfamily enzyme
MTGRSGIDRVDASCYTIPLSAPESDGTLTWDHTDAVVVEIFSDGESGLGYTFGPSACQVLIDDMLSKEIVGRDPMNVNGAWEAMVRAVRNAGRPGIASMAIAAVDIALWDLKSKLLGVPLADLLGRVRDAAPVYGSGGFTSLSDSDLVCQLAGWAQGDRIPSVKMKIATDRGSRPSEDVQRVELVREALGGEVGLMVDANGGYSRKQAVRVGQSFRELGVVWFEEPVSSDDLSGLSEVRQLCDCDVAAGEYGYDLAYFDRLVTHEAVDVVQADVSRCAGITEWMRIAALAAGHGLEISGHCAQSLHLHPACAVSNLRHLEYFADHITVDHLLFDGVPSPDHGCLRPDLTRAGHGLLLKRADAARYRRS